MDICVEVLDVLEAMIVDASATSPVAVAVTSDINGVVIDVGRICVVIDFDSSKPVNTNECTIQLGLSVATF